MRNLWYPWSLESDAINANVAAINIYSIEVYSANWSIFSYHFSFSMQQLDDIKQLIKKQKSFNGRVC